MCLADRLATKVPTATEKQVLQKAGLGIKKIKFEIVVNSETGQTIGFSKLKECGGFELMTCVANCRNLSTLGCAWSVKSIKANIGGQSRIYVRPIQKDLSTTPLSEDSPCEIKEKCIPVLCGQDVLVRNLHTHVYMCSEAAIQSDSGEEELSSSYPVNHLPRPEGSSSNDNQGVIPVMDSNQPVQIVETQDVNVQNIEEESVESLVSRIVAYCRSQQVTDPVEILRYYQSQFVIGRDLDITNPNETCEGVTSYILVDRGNILETSFEEIKEISNLRLTLQVNFYGEVSM